MVESFLDDLASENDMTKAMQHRPTFMKPQNNKMTGFLYKYSPAIFKSWQRRKVVLADH